LLVLPLAPLVFGLLLLACPGSCGTTASPCPSPNLWAGGRWCSERKCASTTSSSPQLSPSLLICWPPPVPFQFPPIELLLATWCIYGLACVDRRRVSHGDGRHGGRGGQPGRGGGAAEPVRVAEAAGLADVQAVPAQPPTALELARCSGAHVLEFLRYLDQIGKTKVHALLQPPVPAGVVPVSAQAGVVQPGRARRPPPHRLRGAQQLAADPQLADAAAGPPAEAGARGSCGGRASGDGCSGA